MVFKKHGVRDFCLPYQPWALWSQAGDFVAGARVLAAVCHEIGRCVVGGPRDPSSAAGGGNSGPSFKKYVYFAVSHVFRMYDIWQLPASSWIGLTL